MAILIVIIIIVNLKMEKEFTEQTKENNESITKDNQPEQKEKEKEYDELDELVSYEMQNQGLETISNVVYLNDNAFIIQKLLFNNNKLTDITEFFPFRNLIYLDLSYNQISKLDNLSPLSNVEILILSNNLIKSIGFNLVSLNRLQHLDIGFNLLEVNDGSLIRSLKFNSELISLVLNGCIDYDYERCKYYCLDILPKIEFLDTVVLIEQKKPKQNSKSYVSVKTKDGKKKKVSTLNDYIKLRQADFEKNQHLYNKNSSQQVNQSNSKKEREGLSSYYYSHIINSMK